MKKSCKLPALQDFFFCYTLPMLSSDPHLVPQRCRWLKRRMSCRESLLCPGEPGARHYLAGLYPDCIFSPDGTALPILSAGLFTGFPYVFWLSSVKEVQGRRFRASMLAVVHYQVTRENQRKNHSQAPDYRHHVKNNHL